MINAITVFVLLLATWLVLSGMFTTFFIILGVISCMLAIVVGYKMAQQTGELEPVFPLLFRLPAYAAWLEWEILKSSLTVAQKIWQLEPDISPTTAWIPTGQTHDIGRTIYANSITLTPGTVSVMVRPDQFQVHALEESGIEALRERVMDLKVAALIDPNIQTKA